LRAAQEPPPKKQSPFLKHALQNHKLQRRLKEQSITFQSHQEATGKKADLAAKVQQHLPKQIKLLSPNAAAAATADVDQSYDHEMDHYAD